MSLDKLEYYQDKIKIWSSICDLVDRITALEALLNTKGKPKCSKCKDRGWVYIHPFYTANGTKPCPDCPGNPGKSEETGNDGKCDCNIKSMAMMKDITCDKCEPKTSCEHEWKFVRNLSDSKEYVCFKCNMLKLDMDGYKEPEPKPKTPSDYQLGFKCGKSHAKAVLRERFEDLIITHGFGPVIFIDNVRELFAPNGKDE